MLMSVRFGQFSCKSFIGQDCSVFARELFRICLSYDVIYSGVRMSIWSVQTINFRLLSKLKLRREIGNHSTRVKVTRNRNKSA